MTKADQYRKRAAALCKRLKPSQVQKTTPVGRKQKALLDMADNEDWLDGKTKASGFRLSSAVVLKRCLPRALHRCAAFLYHRVAVP